MHLLPRCGREAGSAKGGREGPGARHLPQRVPTRGCLPEGAYQKALWPPQTNVCPSTRGVIVTLHPSSSHSPPVASTRGQCTFTARVPDEDIRGLAAFVLERAEAGWAVEAAQ